MDCVSIKACAVVEDSDETCIVRASQVENVESHCETPDFRNGSPQFSQQAYVLFASKLFYIGAIFPDNNVSEHVFSAVSVLFNSGRDPAPSDISCRNLIPYLATQLQNGSEATDVKSVFTFVS
jgi:hypothetical protein